jgi:hypothetical protein
MFPEVISGQEQSAWGNVVFAPGCWFHNWSSKFHLEQIRTDRVDGVLSHSGGLYFPFMKPSYRLFLRWSTAAPSGGRPRITIPPMSGPRKRTDREGPPPAGPTAGRRSPRRNNASDRKSRPESVPQRWAAPSPNQPRPGPHLLPGMTRGLPAPTHESWRLAEALRRFSWPFLCCIAWPWRH